MEPDVAKSEVAQDGGTPPVVSGESLVFKEHLERLSELTLVLLLGGMISLRELPYETIGVAAFLFVIARLAVYVGLMGSGQ
jgi:hypothetical protein